LHIFILETFASAGRSPTLDEIQSRFGLATATEAEARLETLESTGAIHRNPGDPAVTHAYPFSNEQTAHRVRLAGGPEVFAMCAVDALGMPFMLGRDARIESQCEDCKVTVRIELHRGEMVGHAPADTVVWLGEHAEGCVAATDLCPDLNFFCSPGHLGHWREQTGASGEQLSLEQALARGRRVFEHVMA
jgi:hypothetical protein